MLKTKLEWFVLKRVLIVFGLLAILDIALFSEKWFVLCGLCIGGIVGIVRFGFYVMAFSKFLSYAKESGQPRHAVLHAVAVFLANQILLLPLLYVTLKISIWTFAGFVTGVLLVHFVLFINSITEGIGITHNNFQ